MNEIKARDKNFFIFTDDKTPSYLEKSKSLQVLLLEDELPEIPLKSEEFQIIE
jgi:hypothetical protein